MTIPQLLKTWALIISDGIHKAVGLISHVIADAQDEQDSSKRYWKDMVKVKKGLIC